MGFEGCFRKLGVLIWIATLMGCRGPTGLAYRTSNASAVGNSGDLSGPVSSGSPDAGTPTIDNQAGNGNPGVLPCFMCGGEPIEGEISFNPNDLLVLEIPTWACNKPYFQYAKTILSPVSFFDPCKQVAVEGDVVDFPRARIHGGNNVIVGDYVFSLWETNSGTTTQPDGVGTQSNFGGDGSAGLSSVQSQVPSNTTRAACSDLNLRVGSRVYQDLTIRQTDATSIQIEFFVWETVLLNGVPTLRTGVVDGRSPTRITSTHLEIDLEQWTIQIHKGSPRELSRIVDKSSGAVRPASCGLNY